VSHIVIDTGKPARIVIVTEKSYKQRCALLATMPHTLTHLFYGNYSNLLALTLSQFYVAR